MSSYIYLHGSKLRIRYDHEKIVTHGTSNHMERTIRNGRLWLKKDSKKLSRTRKGGRQKENCFWKMRVKGVCPA